MKTISALLLVTALVLAASSAHAYDSGDVQLWLKGSVSGKLGNGVKLKIEQEMRYGDTASELYDEETLLHASYGITDWLKAGLAWRVVQERKNKPVLTPGEEAEDGSPTYDSVGDGDHYWQHEQRPTAELVFGTKLFDFSIADRTRFEWRMKDDGKDNYLRFRNRLKVKSPWKWTDMGINPYAAWEAFVEAKDGGGLNRHRYYVGLGSKLSEHLKGGLYYMLQQDLKSGVWKNTNVAGVEVGASF